MKNLLGLRVPKSLVSIVVAVLVLNLISSAFGLSLLGKQAKAVNLTLVKDTLSSSNPGIASASHTIQFTMASALSSGQEISITFPSGFTVPTAANVTCPATSTASASAQRVECVASGGGISSGAKTVVVTSVGNHSTPGSYQVLINANAGAETGTAMVAIVDYVTVTAAVDATFTFSVAGVAAGQAINGDSTTTSAGATATALPFGTLASGTPKVLAQQLSVTTNAVNGFVVTVRQNNNLRSATGADIDPFVNGSSTSTPTAWSAPTAVLGSEQTYGHYGVTSEDDYNADMFGTALYVGDFATTVRPLFSHDGASDGVTANQGRTRVGYKIQVSALQEAASDYTNRLTYVATPTF